MNFEERKKSIIEYSNQVAHKRDYWIKKNQSFYSDDRSFMRFLVESNLKILDVGCGTGDLLSSLKPKYGMGIDFSPNMIQIAKKRYPNFDFVEGDIENKSFVSKINKKFDIIILSDVFGYFNDCQNTLNNLQHFCNFNTRIIIAYHSWFWEPILKVGEKLGLKMPSIELNWLSNDEILNFLKLTGFEPVKHETRQILPKKLFGLGSFLNRYIGTLPIIKIFSIRNYLVARSLNYSFTDKNNPSTSVIIPCRNEKGNIENIVKRIPKFCNDLEIIFVEGHSKDGTLEEIHSIIKKYSKLNIQVFSQDGKGKGDAVRKGFFKAKGDILMILDADMTVPPEELPKFYKAILNGSGDFINGTRLVYPMQDQAMRFLNFLANRIFSWTFSWLLNQKYTDTLCGTKVLSKRNYERLLKNRDYFGDFDPFGDFDLIFGSAKLNLKTIEIPIRYKAREYGETQISRFTDGWLLIKMVIFAYRKLKII